MNSNSLFKNGHRAMDVETKLGVNFKGGEIFI